MAQDKVLRMTWCRRGCHSHNPSPPRLQPVTEYIRGTQATSLRLGNGSLDMGNKPVAAKQPDEVLVKVVPPLDRAFVRWLSRDLERINGFAPKNTRAVKPPDHYVEYMRLNGWLDLNLDDPDLAHLFK